MKKGFTIIEVSILFVIFLIVAFLVAPLSLDDTMQAKNISRWRSVQQDFSNILYSITAQKEESTLPVEAIIQDVINNEVKNSIATYKITALNGSLPNNLYRFKDFKQTYSNAVISLKLLENSKNDVHGILMYDVNGTTGPNTWGKDVFGLNIYEDKIEPFGAELPIKDQKEDCNKEGTGVFCSNYYLIGGNFD